MPIKLNEIEGWSEIDQLIQRQQQELSDLRRIVTTSQNDAPVWLMQSEANKLFIGRGGKPVDRHTFHRMVLAWIATGQLVEGENYRSGKVRFIRKDFLTGTVKQRTDAKLKRA